MSARQSAICCCGVRPSTVQVVHAGADLLLEAADPLHEELVEIGADDREELDPLEQRGARVLGLVQHAPVEARARSARG